MYLFVVLLSLPIVRASFQFDNALRDKPLIECGHGHIVMNIETEKDAPAHVFAKGHYRKDGCSFSNSTHVVFDFDNCDINRRREVNPRGMSYSMTVIVQLHPLFVTKVDRAFHVHCFYQEADKSVGTGMNVTDPTPTELQQSPELPTCQYTLHKDSAHGPVIKFAQVGDAIYHVWDCPSTTYGMLIHDCNIVDGQGSQHKVIDENGCSTDDYLMPELTYANDLTKTFTASSAFNFPDQNTVYFNCQIKLCVKGTEECNAITPPQCGALSGQKDGIENDLDTDQLITTTTQSPKTESSTSEASTTATAEPSTTTQPETSTTVITTTVTELTSSVSSKPETTTVVVPLQTFPVHKKKFREAVEKTQKENEDDIEGSGVEISEVPTPVSLILSDNLTSNEVYRREGDDEKSTTTKREIKRRDTVVDVDITSPELTIVEKEFSTELPEALRSEKEQLPQAPAVCIPLVGFWLLAALCIVCATIIAAALFYAQKQRNKFRMMV